MARLLTQLKTFKFNNFVWCHKNEAREKVDAAMNHQKAERGNILSRVKNSNGYTMLKSDLLPKLLCLKDRRKVSLQTTEKTKPSNTTNYLTPQSQQTTARSVNIESENNSKPPSLSIKTKSNTSNTMLNYSRRAFTGSYTWYRNPRYKKIYITAILKRSLLPFKTYYELEWPCDKSSVIWLQLDKQICMGIERVRRLGFTNLDVCLDDGLTKYINDFKLIDIRVESILIEVLFIGNSYNIYCSDAKKDSVLQSSFHDKMEAKSTTSTNTNVRLLRLRRVHWWTKNYNLARVYHI